MPKLPSTVPMPAAEPETPRTSMADWFVLVWVAAIMVGAIGGLLWSTLTGYAEWQRAALIGTLVGAALPWAILLIVGAFLFGAWLRQQIVWRLEAWARRDLDQDQIVGDPGRLLIVHGDEARAKAQRMAEAAAIAEEPGIEDMIRFIQTCHAVGTSETAQGIKPAQRHHYVACRQVLEDLGLVRWRNPDNPRLGWDIVGEQAAAIKLVREHLRDRST